ncbi:MAG: ATP-binding protein [Bacteroidota bacterium]
MTKAFYICITFLLLPFFAVAQKATFQFYTIEDGLSNSRIWSAAQDGGGFMWFITDGLNRFDGWQFLNYNNRADSIFQRKWNDLIFCTGKELVFLENDELTFWNTLTGEKRIYSLRQFMEDEDGSSIQDLIQISPEAFVISISNKKVGTIELIKFEKNELSVLATLDGKNHLARAGATDMKHRSRGRVLYFDDEQLVEMDADGETSIVLEKPVMGFPIINYGTNENILVLLDHQIFEVRNSALHPITPSLLTVGHLFYSSFLQTPSGDIWITGDDRQLTFFDARTGRLHSYQEEIKDLIPYRLKLGGMTLNETGVLWVNSVNGLLKVTPQRKWFDTYYTGNREECDGQCSFRGFAEDDNGHVYVSYYSNLFQINPGERTASPPLSSQHFSPFDLHFHDGNLIINNGQLFDVQKRQWSNPYSISLEPFDEGVFAFHEEKGLWFAYKEKLYFLKTSDMGTKWEQVSIENWGRTFECLRFGPSDGKLWMTDVNLLQSYEVERENPKMVDKIAFEEKITIRFVHFSTDGLIWLGTESGLLKYDPESGTEQLFTTSNGLSNNHVVTILPEGDSCLWLGTYHGLSRFSKSTETFINFFEEDGIANNEFNRRSAYKAKSGQLFFGGIGGVTAFFPEEVMEKYWTEEKAGKLSLVSFSKTDVKQDTTFSNVFLGARPEVDIYHQNKTFRFEYVLTDFRDVEKVKYSYQLGGYDNVWSIPSSDNTATFNYLASGTYTFRVKALNSRGQWHNEELTVKVTVHPPWWATWWAYSLYAACLFGIASLVFFYLKKRWQLQNSLKLEQAEAQRLKELDHFKSRLFTNLTHEFRTPLTVILGMANQVLDSPKEGVEKAAQLIKDNGQNLLHLVNQLLDLSKLEDKSFKLHLQQSDIVPFLRYVTGSFQSHANQLNLSLQFRTSLQSLDMDYDPEQLKQVMNNLISNALKFTPSGGEIKVAIGIAEHDEKLLEIEVTDTGVGIAIENLPYVFDRFYQVDGSSTRAGEGTGIGLAHTLELVNLMTGTIAVKSKLGEGTTFLVSLPVTNNAVPTTSDVAFSRTTSGVIPLPANRLVNAKETAVADSSMPSLLIIEDNLDVVYYLKTCLNEQYQITVAYNGRIGIERALEELPDLIISDVMMPEKDGFEVCDTLKNDEKTSHIPIVLLTAKADAISKIAGLRRGADAYLVKPFDKEELLVRLKNLAALSQQLKDRYKNLSFNGEQAAPPEFRMEDAFVQKVQQIVADHFSDEGFALPQLCQKIGMSRSQLFRKMKALMGISPSEYIRNYRMQQARALLETGEWTVSEVAWKVGFKHLPHFSKNFQETFGYSPSATSK